MPLSRYKSLNGLCTVWKAREIGQACTGQKPERLQQTMCLSELQCFRTNAFAAVFHRWNEQQCYSNSTRHIFDSALILLELFPQGCLCAAIASFLPTGCIVILVGMYLSLQVYTPSERLCALRAELRLFVSDCPVISLSCVSWIRWLCVCSATGHLTFCTQVLLWELEKEALKSRR